MKLLCFRLVTFSLYVKPDLLTLVQAIVRVCKFVLKRFLFYYFWSMLVCTMFFYVLFILKKKKTCRGRINNWSKFW